MARPIRNIDIYLPLDYNDGRLIPESKFIALEDELLIRFGGVSSIQREFPLNGTWQFGTEIYRDRVIVLTVMDFREETPLMCLRIWSD